MVSASAPGLFDDDLLIAPEAAHILRISISTLDRMRMDGSGPAFIRVGSGKKRCRIVYRRADLESFLLANRRQSTSE